jgi:flagellar protein FliL
MADEDDAVEAEAEEGAEGEEPQKKRLAGKKLIMFVVLPVVLLLAIGAGVLFSGLLGGDDEVAEGDEATEAASADAEEAPAEPENVVFYDLPEMLVNLNSGDRKSSFLKIQVSLELGSAEAIPAVEAVLPRIVDNFQVYLRELRPEELGGTKGVVRLKEELLVRVNAAVEPVKVYDILFKEILVQS